MLGLVWIFLLDLPVNLTVFNNQSANFELHS